MDTENGQMEPIADEVASDPPAPEPEPPEQERVAYVSFSSEVSQQTTESLLAVCVNLANKGFDTVYLMLSTPGGAVMNGINIYNVLRGMPFKLITHNAGSVNSIGNVVFLAGEERYSCPNATFMFHGVGFDIKEGARLEEKILRERLQAIEADQRRIGSILEERTQLNREQINSLFFEAQTKDSAFAVSCGIVHEIRDVQIPPGGPIVALVFQR